MKKFLFAVMAIAAGLVFGSCASEEEQTEEVVEEVVEEVIDTTAVDTVVVEEPVVEEVAAPEPKKAAKKTAKKEEAKAEENKGITVTVPVKRPQELNANEPAQKATLQKNPNAAATEQPAEKKVELNVSKGGVKVGVKKN